MDRGIRQIAYRQENSGTYMAQAYGMATGKVPVVTAQNGPAATLLVAGLAECLTASHPIVAIVQQVALSDADRNAFQELDHDKLFSGCAKWVRTITKKERIEDYIDMAFTQAPPAGRAPRCCSSRWTSSTMTPSMSTPSTRTRCLGTYPLDRACADPDQVESAAKLLMEGGAPRHLRRRRRARRKSAGGAPRPGGDVFHPRGNHHDGQGLCGRDPSPHHRRGRIHYRQAGHGPLSEAPDFRG